MENEESQTPLLIIEEETTDTQLVNYYLHCLETFLGLFGFCQYSFLSLTLSWILFLLLGFGLPLLIIEFSYCSNCKKYQIKSFELEILVFQSLVAAISLLCISHNLRKYGIRRFLFVDRCHGHMTQFRDEYIIKIKVRNLTPTHFCFLSVYVYWDILIKDLVLLHCKNLSYGYPWSIDDKEIGFDEWKSSLRICLSLRS